MVQTLHVSSLFTRLIIFLLVMVMISMSVVKASDFPFSLGVRDSLMIAHSFHNHPSFGPAGSMHGATYTCDVEFLSEHLHPETNWVIDIGKASDILSDVLVSSHTFFWRRGLHDMTVETVFL